MPKKSSIERYNERMAKYKRRHDKRFPHKPEDRLESLAPKTTRLRGRRRVRVGTHRGKYPRPVPKSIPNPFILQTGIYALVDPTSLTDDIIYIGGAQDIYLRFQNHIRNIKTRKCPKAILRWSINHPSIIPRLLVLELCPPHDLKRLETSWIKLGRDEGWPLLNEYDVSNHQLDQKHEEMRLLYEKVIKDYRSGKIGGGSKDEV